MNRLVNPEELLGPLSTLEKKYAPKELHISGKIELPIPHPRVAIIGTRTASSDGLAFASRLAGYLASEDVIVVSGLAKGIDTAAHKATINAGGRTIAVLGTPLSKTYPKENAELQRLISSDHMAISQFGEKQPVQARNFILRNRTMALIADASVIVESGDGGGSLHQGWEALRLGRPLFIHSREFEKKNLTWPKEMASYGAIEFSEPSEVMNSIPGPDLNLAVTAIDHS